MGRLKVGLLWVGIGVIALGGPSPAAEEEILWHIKAIHPKGVLLDVKAVDPETKKLYDIKAIEQEGNLHMLDVKAFDGDERYPVKIIVSEERYAPIWAIGVEGKNLAVRALTAEGKQLDVKGVRRSGSVIHIKAIGFGTRLFGIKAIAPDGRMYDVKGIKMSRENVETTIGAVQVHAHVKAIPPAGQSVSDDR